MKLKYLKIKNYKSILDFECQLSEGVNVFVGASDSGKSNVIRAIRDFFFNASGDGVVTAKQTRCSIAINDSIWNKGKGVNQYVLPTGTFENVGRTSPQELRDLFKIDEINWDDSHSKKLQFIQQHEPKFFLDESFTGSLNAKILGLVSGIQRTYNGNKLVINDIRDAKARRESALSVKVSAEEELKKYTNLPKQKQVIDVIEKSIEKLEKLESHRDRIAVLLEEVQTMDTLISFTEKCLTQIEIDKTAIQKLHDKVKTNDAIKSVIEDIKDLQSQMKSANISIELDVDMNDISLLKEKIEKGLAIRRAGNALVKARNSHRDEMRSISASEVELQDATSELKELVDETKTCPLTGDQFCEGCKDKIMECKK